MSLEHDLYVNESPIPLSNYAKKLEPKVKKRYEEKISDIGVDPMLIEGKYFQPDCLPPVESTDLLFYLVLETSYYTKRQFKAFRSLEAYNQMVCGFITGVQGHMMGGKFVVVAKVRHSQRMNDPLISIWIITEKQGTVISAHCCGCKAGLGESYSHIASVLFYLEPWTKINGKLSCAQVKCSWILPSYVSEVDYSRIRDINFKSAKKLKADLDKSLDQLSTGTEAGKPQMRVQAKVNTKAIPVPTSVEMESFYADLSKCKSKPVSLSLVSPYADSFVLKSQTIPTIHGLSTPQYQDLTYPELLQVCHEQKIVLSAEQISQIEKDTRDQAQGTNFFKHTSCVVSQEVEDLVRSILGPSYQGVNIQHVQQQQNFCDCGVFAIAFATCLVYAKFPQCVCFNIPMMRPHLLKCLKNRSMELFPTV